MTNVEVMMPTMPQARAASWDAVVVGAGPSGSTAARELARRGVSVLLVDKAPFPRKKVCGCYLNGAALATLKRCRLEGLSVLSGAPRVTRIRVGTRFRVAELELPPGTAVSREAFDMALVEAAIAAGAVFLSGTEARLGESRDDWREVRLIGRSAERTVRSKVIVAADGISGRLLSTSDEVRFHTSPESLVGIAAVTDDVADGSWGGTINMAIGPEGYVGALQLEDGRLDVAAAVHPIHLKHARPGELEQAIIAQSGLPSIDGIRDLAWSGTPRLSRRPAATAGHRLFLVGDAAGYVEPFTGEGISWALRSGRAVAPIAHAAVLNYSPELMREWSARHHRLLGMRQAMCRWVTACLRRPRLTRIGITVLRRLPFLANPVIRALNSSAEGMDDVKAV